MSECKHKKLLRVSASWFPGKTIRTAKEPESYEEFLRCADCGAELELPEVPND